MRRRRSPRGTGRARCAGAPTTSTFARCGHEPGAGADAIDDRLHAERLDPRTRARRLHQFPFGELPDGAFVIRDDMPWLVLGGRLLAWSPGGYRERVATAARGTATVITPPSLVALLRTERTPLVPLLHPSAL